MEKNNQINLEDKVMSQIKSGRIKLRSKYLFLAEKLGLGSAFILTFMLAALFFGLSLFYLKATDNLWYLSFGSRGFLAFLESFPFLLVIGWIILLFLAGFIFRKSGVLYDRPFGYLALALVGFIIIIGTIFTFTHLTERMEGAAFGSRSGGMFFKPFFKPGLDERERGIAGRIVEIGQDYISLQTPSRVVKVDLKRLEEGPQNKLSVGMFVVAVGEKKGDSFEALGLHNINNEEEMPMIRRGVHRRFGSFETPPPSFPER
ncbi:MAG: hypothetical protein NTU97_03635 [Candidatus Magasanikbacteria bacterium]|nr:hypothetical protein [Candidatus Magasanikbacteria bacterium]